MIKLILAVALLSLPVNSTGKKPSIDKRLQDLTTAARKDLIACQAQEGVEYCTMRIVYTEWRKKGSELKKDDTYIALESKGAPFDKGWLYTNPKTAHSLPRANPNEPASAGFSLEKN